MVYAGYVARADTEKGPFRFPVGGFDQEIAVAPAYGEQSFHMREHEALRRIIGIGQMYLEALTVLVGYGLEEGIAAASRERCNDVIALPLEQVRNLQHVIPVNDAGLHAASFSTRTGSSCAPFS